jgi:hypothetical protein
VHVVMMESASTKTKIQNNNRISRLNANMATAERKSKREDASIDDTNGGQQRRSHQDPFPGVSCQASIWSQKNIKTGSQRERERESKSVVKGERSKRTNKGAESR